MKAVGTADDDELLVIRRKLKNVFSTFGFYLHIFY